MKIKKLTILKSIPLLCFGVLFVPATILFKKGEIAVAGGMICGIVLQLILYQPIKREMEREQRMRKN